LGDIVSIFSKDLVGSDLAVARTKVLTRLDRTTDVTGPKGPSSPVRAAPAHRTQLDLEVDVEHQHMLSACARAKEREIITTF